MLDKCSLNTQVQAKKNSSQLDKIEPSVADRNGWASFLVESDVAANRTRDRGFPGRTAPQLLESMPLTVENGMLVDEQVLGVVLEKIRRPSLPPEDKQIQATGLSAKSFT